MSRYGITPCNEQLFGFSLPESYSLSHRLFLLISLIHDYGGQRDIAASIEYSYPAAVRTLQEKNRQCLEAPVPGSKVRTTVRVRVPGLNFKNGKKL